MLIGLMVHYHVWFNLKPDLAEAPSLAVVSHFLTALCEADEAATFQLLKNKGEPPRSKLPRYHALVQFADDAKLGAAMRNQAACGVHIGLHGQVVDVVTDFHVEIFSEIPAERI